jgi:hypothetical protein
MCDALHERYSIDWFAEYSIAKLQHVADWGLPDCYKTFTDYLFDFWPDLPLGSEKALSVCFAIVNDDRFHKILVTIHGEWGVNMLDVLAES